MFFALACLLLAIGVWARFAIGRVAVASAVDGHYWLLAARTYHEQRGLPVRIRDKYLMEDETQAYPPFFGFLLGCISNRAVLRWVTTALELLEILVLGVLLHALGAHWDMLLLALSCYVTAPVLVVYNTQLTPRILGDLFLFSAMVLQLAATMLAVPLWAEWLCWIASAVLLGLVVATHKMTLQLHLVLLALWWWVLSAWQVPVATLMGIVLYIAIAGWRFVGYQFLAHWDIVRFWHRHWRDLGGHQFNLSPIYGDPRGDRTSCFHLAGWCGVVKHLRVLVSYAPLNLLLPLGSLLSGVWPPDWVLVWICGVYVWAISTLFIPALKCLGGGHFYIFNAIAPGAIYIAYLPATMPVLGVFVVGVTMTALSLFMAWRIVRARPTARGKDFASVIEHLKQIPKSRISVFPLQSAEAVAGETEHAVLWGGHGYGFQNLEGFFPVLTRPLGDFLRQYDIQWILWDSVYWPKGEETLNSKNLVQAGSILTFGRWRLGRTNMPTTLT
jgi:hypothetical protein